MAWKKGESGNPRGRPKVVGDLRDLARKYGGEGLRLLAAIARDQKQPAHARVMAIRELLDRGYGKAVSQHDLMFFNNKTNSDGGEVVIEVKFGKERQLEDEAAMRVVNPRPLLEDRRPVDVRTPRIDHRSDDWPGKYRNCARLPAAS
jgi:hypothetical protein